MTLRLVTLAAVGLAAACATPGQVRRVETQVAVLRAQTAREDSARAAELSRIIAMQERILDSVTSTREALRQFRGQSDRDMLEVQQQLVQIQELTGQSQRRLAELKRQIDDRSDLLATGTATAADTTTPAAGGADSAAAGPPPATPTPDQLYQASLRELGRGSLTTARAGFHEFLRTYPTHAQVPDALYFTGETFAVENADSASHYYREVVQRFPASGRAPTSLYKLGLLAERRQDRAAARTAYQRVIQQYPRAPEATLARDRLAALQP